jgi:hypothetical protein
MYSVHHLKEGLGMLKRHKKISKKGYTRLGNSAKEICESIVEKNWNNKFYTTSLGHYPVFYARDFGMVARGLIDLGYKERVRKTVKYALECYRKGGRITSFINSKGKPVNFPEVYSPDSTAYILHCLVLLNDNVLVERFRKFLEKEILKFYKKVVHPITGEVKRHIHFQGMRDHYKRDSSCYDTVMCWLVSTSVDALGLHNPLKRFNYKELLVEKYWTGMYFRDDQSTQEISADANIYPFWFGIINDEDFLLRVIKSVEFYNLDKPFPISYSPLGGLTKKTILAEHLVSGWEDSCIWPMSGLPYIYVVRRVKKDLAKKYFDKYTNSIEKYGTLIEVFTMDEKPFRSSFYSADEGMIWAVLYLLLDKEFNK